MANDDLRRINIPIPNPGLSTWLKGSECRAAVETVTDLIFTAYQNTLPVRTGNLKRGAFRRVDISGWGTDQDRWFGWVGNTALSYRKQTGKPYPRYIEYGKHGVGGQHQLRNAAHLVSGQIGQSVNIPGIKRDSGGRLHDAKGRFTRNPLNKDK